MGRVISAAMPRRSRRPWTRRSRAARGQIHDRRRDPRDHDGRQDRHGPDRRHRRAELVVHRLRPGRQPAGRDRGGRRAGRPRSARAAPIAGTLMATCGSSDRGAPRTATPDDRARSARAKRPILERIGLAVIALVLGAPVRRHGRGVVDRRRAVPGGDGRDRLRDDPVGRRPHPDPRLTGRAPLGRPWRALSAPRGAHAPRARSLACSPPPSRGPSRLRQGESPVRARPLAVGPSARGAWRRGRSSRSGGWRRARAGVAVEVLVEEHVVAPVRVRLEPRRSPKTGRRPSASRRKIEHQPRASSSATCAERHRPAGAGRASRPGSRRRSSGGTSAAPRSAGS